MLISSELLTCITRLSHVIPVLDIQQISYDYDLGYGFDVELENRFTRNVQSHEMTAMFFLEESETRPRGSYAVWSEVTPWNHAVSLNAKESAHAVE